MIRRTDRASLFRLAACALVGLASPRALAQSASAPPSPAADTATPAPAAAPDPKLEEARRHFAAGLQLLRDPDGEQPEAAYIEFKTAHDLSGSPRVLGNIGYCAMKLERVGEAIEAYTEYLRVVPNVDPRERAQIEEDLKTLNAGAAKIVVTVSGDAEWTILDERAPVRGEPITNTYGPFKRTIELLVHSGHHVIKGRIGGSEQDTWELDAAGGATLTHAFAPKPPPKPIAPAIAEHVAPPPAPSHAVPWLLTGVGAAAVVAGSITGVVALQKTKSLDTLCPNDACPTGSSYASDVRSTRTFATATDFLLVGGGLAVVTGVTWLLVTPSHRAPAATIGAAWIPGGGPAAAVRVSY